MADCRLAAHTCLDHFEETIAPKRWCNDWAELPSVGLIYVASRASRVLARDSAVDANPTAQFE